MTKENVFLKIGIWPHYKNRKKNYSTILLIHWYFWQFIWNTMCHWPQISWDTKLEEGITGPVSYLRTTLFSSMFSYRYNCFVYFWNIVVSPSIHIYNLYSSICIICVSSQIFLTPSNWTSLKKTLLCFQCCSLIINKDITFLKNLPLLNTFLQLQII